MPDYSSNSSPLPSSKLTGKKGCLKKMLIGLAVFIGMVVILVVFVIFVLPFILNLTAKDIGPINDSDILPKTVKVADADNAYFDLKGIADITDEPEIDLSYITLKKWDQTDVSKILDKNKAAFAKWDLAVKKPSFQDPLYADLSIPPPYKSGYPTVFTSYQKIARLNILRGLNEIQNGSAEAGLNLMIDDLRLGQKFQHGGSGLVVDLIGSALKLIGYSGIQTIVPKLKLSHQVSILLENELDSFPYDPEGLKMGFQQEYFAHAYEVDAIAASKQLPNQISSEGKSDPMKMIRDTASNKFYFEPNKTKQLYANFFRSTIKSVDTPCTNLQDVNFERDPKIVVDWRFRENGMGILVYNIGSTSFTGLVNNKCYLQIELGLTKLLFALRAYQNEKGSLPTTVDALVPTYISEIPVDPYTGEKLKYSASKKVIYSDGKDKKDDGGDGAPNSINAKDYVIPIKF